MKSMFITKLFTVALLVSSGYVYGQKSGAYVNPNDEMAVYRSIIDKNIATKQDLADLMAMQAETFDSLGSPSARLRDLNAKTGFTFTDAEASEPVTRGETALALMKSYDLEQGVFYLLTGWQRYALKDVQQAGIMQSKFSIGQIMTGLQLSGVINTTVETTEKKSNWGEE